MQFAKQPKLTKKIIQFFQKKTSNKNEKKNIGDFHEQKRCVRKLVNLNKLKSYVWWSSKANVLTIKKKMKRK